MRKGNSKSFVRIVSVLMSFVMVASLFSGFVVPASAATNGHTLNDALEWMKDKADTNWWQDVDGEHGCQCVDLIFAYYKYLGSKTYSGHAYTYADGKHMPAEWTIDHVPAPGAIFVCPANVFNGVYTGSEYGHVGLVYAINDDGSLVTVETNTARTEGRKNGAEARIFDGSVFPITKGVSRSRKFNSNVWYIHPDFVEDEIVRTYRTYVSMTTQKNGYLKSLPCSASTNPSSVNVIDSAIPNGATVVADKLVVNTAGNFWYHVTYNGKSGYMFCDNLSNPNSKLSDSDAFSYSGPFPTGNLVLGKSFTLLNGIVSTKGALTKVTGRITNTSTKETLYEFSKDLPSVAQYSIGSDFDNAMAFSKLPVGNYTFTITAAASYSTVSHSSGSTVNIIWTTNVPTIMVKTGSFTVSKDGTYQPTTDETTFNSNKTAVNQLMIVSAKSTYYYASPNVNASTKTISFNSSLPTAKVTNSATFGEVLYADYKGTNTDGTEFYHLAKYDKGLICDQTGGTYILATDLMPLVDGSFHNATHTVLYAYETAAASDTKVIFSIPSGESFVFTGASNGRQQIEYNGKKGWTRIGYAVLDTAHDWGAWTTVETPTCVEEGTEQRVCSICNKTETRSKAAIGHSYVKTETVSPTCTKTGYTVFVCSKCGDRKTENVTQALGHNYISTTISATCTAQGYIQHKCSRCSDTYKDSYTAVLGHNYSTKVTNPTCTSQGYSTHTCSRCSNSYVDTYVAATGHKYDNACDTNCNVCGATRTTSHNYGAWVTDKAATCTATGTEKRTCSVCGAIETRTTTALGHNYTTTVTNPTCTAQGFLTHTCSRCKDSYVDTYTAALGHKYGDWIIEKEATTAEEGSRKKVCSACGDTVTEKIEKLPQEEVVRKQYDLNVMGSKFTINGKTQRTAYFADILSGDKVVLNFTGSEKFLYWVDNSNKQILSTSATYEFFVTTNTTIVAICVDEEDIGDTEAYVLFTNGSGQMLSASFYSDTDDIDFPANPSKTGKAFVGWNKTESEIKAAMATSALITVEPVFEAVGGTYSINVKYSFEDNLGTHEDDVYTGKNVGESYKLIAPEIDGYVFAYWMSNGKIVSYADSFYMMGKKNLELTAMYTKESVEKKAIAFVANIEKEETADGKHKLKFTEIYSTPDNCTFVESGFVRTTMADYANKDKLTLDNVDGSSVKKSTSSDKSGGGFYVSNLSMSDDNKVVYIRAYVTYIVDGVTYTDYSDIASASFNNLDFTGGADESEETGD